MEVRLKYRQSLLDIAIQEYGSVSEVFLLAVQNNVSLTDVVAPGTVLILPNAQSSQPDIKSYYKKKQLRPATAIDEATLPPREEGIGFWAIGLTFKVS